MPNKITKAIFPVAGLGTRLLPATKSGPKEMLPIVDKPLLQYAVEEAASAGITEMIFVTGQWKYTVKKHFERSPAIEKELILRQETELLKLIQNIKPKHVKCFYVNQPAAQGLGQAILFAQKLVKDASFAVILVDDLIDATPPVIQQMIDLFKEKKCSIIAAEKISKEETVFYGVLDIKSQHGKLIELNQVIEKPKPVDAPSLIGVAGRYIFTPDIFNCLKKALPGKNRELQLTDGIQKLLEQKRVIAYQYDGKRFDCGSKMGYLKATVQFALKHPELSEKFTSYLNEIFEKQKNN